MSSRSIEQLRQLGMRMQRGLSPSERAAMITEATELAYKIGQSEVPVDKGDLKKDMQRRVETAQERGVVFHESKVANYINDGTKAHIIRAKKAKALAFMAGGRMVFRKMVRHPGTKANPYFQRTADRAERMLELRMLPYVERILIEIVKP